MGYVNILAEMYDQDSNPDDVTTEPTELQFSLGTAVEIKSLDGLSADDIGVTEGAFQSIQTKVEAGERALIFNEYGNQVDVVFRDGKEAFGIELSNLRLIEDPDFEDTNLDQYLEI